MIVKSIRRTLVWFKDVLKSSKTLRRLLYDLENTKTFTSLRIHERMVADRVRVDNYHKAISRHVRPGDVVVDLGTGTGLLAFLASKWKPEVVYAVDHSDFIDIALRLAKHNNIHNVTFVKENSRDFSPDKKIDVILHEQMGNDLFNENMIENILDLKKRLLNENGIILPDKFELYIEPVCMKSDYRVPYIWENDVHGIDFSVLRDYKDAERYKPANYDRRTTSACSFDYFLCKPEPVIRFSISELESESDLPAHVSMSRKIIRAGRIDALCVYFRVIFDDEISFDTSPFHTNTHWNNRVFRTESKLLMVGEIMEYDINFAAFSDSDTWTIAIR